MKAESGVGREDGGGSGAPQEGAVRLILRRFWDEHLSEFTVHYAADLIKGIELYGGLALFQWFNRLMASAGTKPEYLEQLDKLHFLSAYAIYLWLAVMFLWRLVPGSGQQAVVGSARPRRK